MGHFTFAKIYDRAHKRIYLQRKVLECVLIYYVLFNMQIRKSVAQNFLVYLVPPAVTRFHCIGINLLGRLPKSAPGS